MLYNCYFFICLSRAIVTYLCHIWYRQFGGYGGQSVLDGAFEVPIDNPNHSNEQTEFMSQIYE